jgi:hypothetical protein
MVPPNKAVVATDTSLQTNKVCLTAIGKEEVVDLNQYLVTDVEMLEKIGILRKRLAELGILSPYDCVQVKMVKIV